MLVDPGAQACSELPPLYPSVLWILSRTSGSGPRLSKQQGGEGGAPEVQEEGEREKFEKQATRGEPDKPGPGRAEPGLGPRNGGGRALGGRSAAEASTAADPSGRVGNPETPGAAWLHETRFPKTPDTFKSPAQGAELRFWLRPRPDP